MTKTFFPALVLAFLSIAGPSWAGDWTLDLGVRADRTLAEWNPAYTTGFGGKLGLSREIGPDLSLALEASYLRFSGDFFGIPVVDEEFRFLPVLRLFAARGPATPYLLAGAGVAAQVASFPGDVITNFNPDFTAGGGLELSLAGSAWIYLEACYSLIPVSGHLGQDLPFGLGVRCSL